MKNLYKLLIGVLALSTVTSCDDYLESRGLGDVYKRQVDRCAGLKHRNVL